MSSETQNEHTPSEEEKSEIRSIEINGVKQNVRILNDDELPVGFEKEMPEVHAEYRFSREIGDEDVVFVLEQEGPYAQPILRVPKYNTAVPLQSYGSSGIHLSSPVSINGQTLNKIQPVETVFDPERKFEVVDNFWKIKAPQEDRFDEWNMERKEHLLKQPSVLHVVCESVRVGESPQPQLVLKVDSNTNLSDAERTVFELLKTSGDSKYTIAPDGLEEGDKINLSEFPAVKELQAISPQLSAGDYLVREPMKKYWESAYIKSGVVRVS
jgi:hypothetical protein